MQWKPAVVALCVLPLVTACDGDNTLAAQVASKYYNATYTDGESLVIDKLFSTGLTGFVGNSDGTVSEIRVRADIDAEEFYVSIDGGPETVYDEFIEGDGDDFGGYLVLANAAGRWVYTEFYGVEPAFIDLWDESSLDSSEGYFGLETAAAALPTETATYSGEWSGYGETDTTGIEAGGYMNLAVGFASGNLTGYTDGGFYAWNDDTETSDGGSFVGGITGTVTGSRIAGTMTVDGDASGELDPMGAIYGENAEYAAGGVGGSLTSEAGTQSLGGDFYLYQSEGCGPFC